VTAEDGAVPDDSRRRGALRAALWVGGAAAALAVVFAAHASILAAPPYDEYACVHLESAWLSENGCDFERLRDEEASFRRGGGPVIYLTSAVPSLFALLIRYGPGNPANLVVAHAAMLTLGTAILVVVFSLVRQRLRSLDALLAVGMLASHPTFQSQVEMLGVDVPMTAFSMLAVWLAARGWTAFAALAAVLAFLMKPTGLIVGVAVAAYFAARLALDGGPWRSRMRWIAGLACMAAGLAFEAVVLQWSGLAQDLRQPVHEKIAAYFPVLKICPDLPAACILAVALYVLSVVARLTLFRPASRPSFLAALRDSVEQEGPAWMCAAVVVGVLYGIFFEVRLPGPRYFLLAATAAVAPAAYALALLPRAVLWIVSLAVIGLNLANLDGRLYPSVDDLSCTRVGAILERSLEYRRDLFASQRAVDAILQSAPGAVVLAPHHLTHWLAVPALGASPAPVAGYAAGEYTRADFPPVAVMMRDRPRDVIFIAVDSLPGSVFSHIDVPPPAPGDEVLFNDGEPSPLIVYRKQLPESPADYDDWCLKNLWYGREDRLARSEVSLLTRAVLLNGAGRSDLADRLLQMRIQRFPDELKARLDLAEQMLATSRPSSARPLLEGVLAQCPDDPRANVLLARALADLGESADAEARFDRAASLAPEDASLWLWRGVLERRTDRWEDARKSLDRSLRLDAWNPDGFVELALIAAQEERFEEAATLLERACRLWPYQWKWHFLRAAALDQLGRTSQATRALNAAARYQPALRTSPRPLPPPASLLGQVDLPESGEANRP
jgi:Flp pilus assembly protein TadD